MEGPWLQLLLWLTAQPDVDVAHTRASPMPDTCVSAEVDMLLPRWTQMPLVSSLTTQEYVDELALQNGIQRTRHLAPCCDKNCIPLHERAVSVRQEDYMSQGMHTSCQIDGAVLCRADPWSGNQLCRADPL